MFNLAKDLQPIEIKLDQILLDPNNPRFSELGEDLNTVLEKRFCEQKIQDDAFRKMKNKIFDVAELRDTIRTVGFLPVDNIIVKKITCDSSSDGDKYVVIEGNRRITAIKWLLELHNSGKENLEADFIESLQKINALELLSGSHEMAHLILPGLRHISGIKEWGPYQKAKAIAELRRSGMSPQEAAQSIGLGIVTANRSYRCYQALEQMKQDEEYGDHATTKHYSYFEEVFKKPEVKDWLGWDENKLKFTNEINISKFYSWISDAEDDSKILSQAHDIRDLALIVKDSEALRLFESSKSLKRAIAKYESDHPSNTWVDAIESAMTALKNLSTTATANLTDDDKKRLDDLKVQIDFIINSYEKLRQSGEDE